MRSNHLRHRLQDISSLNRRSRETFAKRGDIIGHDLMQYHPAHAQAKIREMLAEGTANTYTVERTG